MPDKHDIDIGGLERRVTALSDALAHLGNADDLKRLILILRRPGWTTPAEFIFASGIVESMLAHSAALTKLRGDLLQGSEAVIARQ
jgi:hypothetical protein